MELHETNGSNVGLVTAIRSSWNLSSCSCWLSSLPFYLSFILPIGLIILIIGILFLVVGHSFFCGKSGRHVRSNQMAESHRRSRFSIAFCCFVALTLAWIFALFAIGPVRVVLQILFCIFGSLAGFLIFLLYLITSKAKRPYWNSKFPLHCFSLSQVCRFRYVEISGHAHDLFSNIVIVVRFSQHPRVLHFIE